MNTAKISLLWVVVAGLLGACSSTPVAPPPVVATKPVAAVVDKAPVKTEAAKPTPTVTPPVRTATLPPYLDPNSEISKDRSVYFSFDDNQIAPQFNPMLETQGHYLAANPQLAIKVEGNTDERGSSEYNLALGQRRAEAVVKALTVFGVKPNQMEAVSWGKEKPKAPGHDETAWAENRRADLQYPAK
jgi:peptidoglycan-associated lipoprotein